MRPRVFIKEILRAYEWLDADDYVLCVVTRDKVL